jgi:hypothetical protein
MRRNKQRRHEPLVLWIAALAVVLLTCFAFCGKASGTPVLATTDNISWPIYPGDSSNALWRTPDSFNVAVWGPGAQAANSSVYQASGDIDAAWIDSINVGNGTREYYFRDSVADIDGGAGDGYYSVVVNAWFQGKRFPNRFGFYLSANNTNTVYDRIDENVSTGTVDVVSYGGTAGTFAAGRPEVNVSHWDDDAVVATGDGVPWVNVDEWDDTDVPAPTIAGYPYIDAVFWKSGAIPTPDFIGTPFTSPRHTPPDSVICAHRLPGYGRRAHECGNGGADAGGGIVL